MIGRILRMLSLSLAICAPGTALASSAAPEAGKKRDAPVAAGETAPDFTLEDQDGRRHALSAERGKRAVVLVFYRGHW